MASDLDLGKSSPFGPAAWPPLKPESGTLGIRPARHCLSDLLTLVADL